MRIRPRTDIAAALLLVAVLALFAGFNEWPGRNGPPGIAHPSLPPAGSKARARFDACRQNVATIHDLYWASACTVLAEDRQRHRAACLESARASPSGKPAPGCQPDIEDDDDSPDCMLPEDRARRLNEARMAAEQECLDDATDGTHKARDDEAAGG